MVYLFQSQFLFPPQQELSENILKKKKKKHEMSGLNALLSSNFGLKKFIKTYKKNKKRRRRRWWKRHLPILPSFFQVGPNKCHQPCASIPVRNIFLSKRSFSYTIDSIHLCADINCRHSLNNPCGRYEYPKWDPLSLIQLFIHFSFLPFNCLHCFKTCE